MNVQSHSAMRHGRRAPSGEYSDPIQPCNEAFRLEELEARQLLSSSPDGVHPWAPYATLVGQDQAVAQYPYLDGTTVRVAVIDRGIDYNMPELGGGLGVSKKVMIGLNFRDSSGIALDDYGHGTGVAGIIAENGFAVNGVYDQGLAPNTQIIDLKQENSAGIKNALDWVIANAARYNIQVVNITDFITDVLPNSAKPQLYTSELQTLHDMGIFLVTPVGNGEATFGPGVPIFAPASDPNVMGIGGEDQNAQMWNDSRRGTGLDLVAPSFNVTMTYYVKNPAGVGMGYDQYDDNYTGTGQLVGYAKGTSWASAYTAGTAVLLKQIDRTLTPDQIKQILTETGTPVNDPEDIDGISSYPSLNVLKAIQMAYNVADDKYHFNYSIKRAVNIPFKRGTATLAGAKLLIGKTDVWSFTITDTRTVLVKTNYAGATKLPLVRLSNARGQSLGAVTSRGLSIRLGPGTYYLYYEPTQSLDGPYGFTVSTLGVGSKASAKAAVVNAFATTAVSADTVSSDDVVLSKKHSSVFA